MMHGAIHDSYLAVGCSNSTVMIFQLSDSSSSKTQELNEHTSSLSSMDMNVDFLAVGASSDVVEIYQWNRNTNAFEYYQRIHNTTVPDALKLYSSSTDGTNLLIGTDDTMVHRYKLNTAFFYAETYSGGLTTDVSSVDVSDDGKFLAFMTLNVAEPKVFIYMRNETSSDSDSDSDSSSDGSTSSTGTNLEIYVAVIAGLIGAVLIVSIIFLICCLTTMKKNSSSVLSGEETLRHKESLQVIDMK